MLGIFDDKNLGMQIKNTKGTIFLLLFAWIFTACEDVPSNRRFSTVDPLSGGGNGTTNGGGGNYVTPIDDALNNAIIVEAPTVEIRHLIEPKVDSSGPGGVYLKKLTMPKNYNGLLYLAGINVNTLSSKNIKVRFRFGVDSVPIDIPATVSTASGLTPQTNVEVLIMDMRGRPFNNVQLIYDLFDYNDYDFTGTNTNKVNEPVQFNRNQNLFCRGLALKDDPTFRGNLANGCVGSTDVCKYAYAKVVDRGLTHINSFTGLNTPITPAEPTVQSGNSTYYEDTHSLKLSRCLADNPMLSTVGRHRYDNVTLFNQFFETKTIDGLTYRYDGPYRITNTAMWEIGSDAITNLSFGLYQRTNYLGLPIYYNSKLFPLYSKFNLLKDTEYLGSAIANDEKTIQSMASNGESLWLDGCNARVTSVDNMTGEHVGSCNVTASIAIVSIEDDGTEKEVDVSKEVKLQLVKPATLNIEGDNVLLSSFQSCSSSSQCGSDECCMGKRCWSKSIVSQCVEDMPSYGLLNPGASCISDHECSSLCCNKMTGRCAVHDTLQDPPVLCSKFTGDKCIAKEWCMKHPVTRCFIIKTGPDTLGNPTCALRCYTFEEHGECEQGICKSPPPAQMPDFNPNAPNCLEACDPPDFSNGYFDFKCGK
jgi:hypothetical protein